MSRGKPFIQTAPFAAERRHNEMRARDARKLEKLGKRIEAAKSKRAKKLAMEMQRP